MHTCNKYHDIYVFKLCKVVIFAIMNEEHQRSRRWIFTWNNYDNESQELLSNLVETKALTYVIYGKELAPTTGTPHLQGYLETRIPMTKRALSRKYLSHCFLRIAEKGSDANERYCSKDGDVTKLGSPMQQGKRSDLEAVSEMIHAKRTIREIAEVHTVQMIKFHRGIQLTMSLLKPQRRTWKTKVIIYIGSTGTGKSRLAHERLSLDPDEFYTHGGDRWFDGYMGQKNVLFDDFEGVTSGITYRKLLQLTDRYPLQVPIKGAFAWWVPETIIFTTNVRPQAWYPSEMDVSPLMRRIDEIRDFDIFPYHPESDGVENLLE